MQKETIENQTLATVMDRLRSGAGFSTQDVLRLKREAHLIDDLAGVLPEQPASIRRGALELLIDIGRPRLEPKRDLPERLGPYIEDPRVVTHLVGALSDTDPAVRSAASAALVDEVPDLVLRNFSPQIITTVQNDPALDGGVLLLGKTGAEWAKTTILSVEVLRTVDAAETQAALARLGDREAENAVIRAYREAADPDAKAEAARRLGYVATLRCALTLARDIRTPQVYVWSMRSRRSMRVHVIEGLHLNFPTEAVFWKPFFKPQSDAFYEAIETWLTENLGVTWDRPRPQFLYQEDAPVPPPGG